jgi:hypothetical protein
MLDLYRKRPTGNEEYLQPMYSAATKSREIMSNSIIGLLRI